MSLCEQIAAKLVAEEVLSDREQAHQETCEECRGFKNTLVQLKDAVKQTQAYEAPQAGEAENIRRFLDERINARRQISRRMLSVSFATVVVVCVGLVGLWLWVSRAPSEEDAELSANQLLALLDEVDTIYESPSEVVKQYPVQALHLLSEADAETAVLEDSDLNPLLPGAYNSLNEWFSDRS
jgi:predicted anti-sigma-YlaC factor YlaD